MTNYLLEAYMLTDIGVDTVFLDMDMARRKKDKIVDIIGIYKNGEKIFLTEFEDNKVKIKDKSNERTISQFSL